MQTEFNEQKSRQTNCFYYSRPKTKHLPILKFSNSTTKYKRGSEHHIVRWNLGFVCNKRRIFLDRAAATCRIPDAKTWLRCATSKKKLLFEGIFGHLSKRTYGKSWRASLMQREIKKIFVQCAML